MSGRVGLIAGGVAGAVVVGGLMYFAFAPVETAPVERTARPEKAEEEVRPTARATVAEVKPTPAPVPSNETAKTDEPKAAAKKPMTPMPDWFEDLPSGKDRTIARNVQEARDAEDLKALREASAQARKSSNPEVRKAAVEALGWFGERAVADLTGYLQDKDKGVAQAAIGAWDNAVDNLHDDRTRVQIAGTTMAALTDEAALATVASKIEATDEKLLAVDALVNVIESGNAAAAMAAKESYQHIMGEPYERAAKARGEALLHDWNEKNGNDDL